MATKYIKPSFGVWYSWFGLLLWKYSLDNLMKVPGSGILEVGLDQQLLNFRLVSNHLEELLNTDCGGLSPRASDW